MQGQTSTLMTKRGVVLLALRAKCTHMFPLVSALTASGGSLIHMPITFGCISLASRKCQAAAGATATMVKAGQNLDVFRIRRLLLCNVGPASWWSSLSGERK